MAAIGLYTMNLPGDVEKESGLIIAGSELAIMTYKKSPEDLSITKYCDIILRSLKKN